MVQGDIKCTATFAPRPDGGATGDGGGVADGGQCNVLVNNGPVVSIMQVAAAPPTYVGGPLMSGTYLMTAANTYTGPGGATGDSGTTIREKFVYFGSSTSGPVQAVISVDGAANVPVNASLAHSDPSILVIDYTCGPLAPVKHEYTSNDVELRVFDDSLQTEWVFTRQ